MEPVLTKPFVVVTAASLAYFLAIGITIPVLPLYVEEELGGGGVAVGIAAGAFAVTAAILRPWTGRIGDRLGRRVLILAGAAIAGVSLLGYGVGDSLVVLVVMRLLTGVGEAAVFVGAATTAQDLAPPARRGEATSYFSIAIYGGLAIGPLLGETLRDEWGSTAAWGAGAIACGVAFLIALLVPDDRGRPHAPEVRRGLLQRNAVRPGIVLALAMTGYAGFATFVPLYVDDIDIADAGPVLTAYAVIVLVIRIFGARIPDRIGAVTTTTVALASLAGGLGLMALVPNAVGLYAGTFVFSCGQSMMYPSLFPLVVNAAPEAERAHAIATFTMFFDLSQLSAIVLGVVVSLTDERGAFATAAATCLLAIAVLRTGDLTGDALDEDLRGHRAAEGAVLPVDP